MMKFLILIAASGFAFGEDKKGGEEENKDPAEGHSIHGEVFNKGPRQAAVLIPGTGDVQFKITTKSAEAQKFFDQGIGQLHGYWDFEAERSFRQASMLDPKCAMNYWGMAQANFKNNERGKGFSDEAVKRKEGASEREKMWIDGLAGYFKDIKADKKKRLRDYIRTVEKIAAKYPDDIEARAFLLKQIYYNHRNGHPIPSHFTIDLLAKQILEKNPDHPVHHYRIHLWDRELTENALDSAAAGGPAAPGIAHMWHMPGHIYSYAKRYTDGAWQQEASARVDHAHMIRYRLIPDEISNFAHNNEWCIRNLNHIGRFKDAIDLSKNMIELPRIAKMKGEGDKAKYDPSGSSWQYGRQRLRDTLFRFESWDTLIAISETNYLRPDDKSLTQNDHDKFIGIAKFENGNHAGGLKHLAAIEKRLREEEKKRDAGVAKAEKKAKDDKKEEKQIESAKKAAEKTFAKKIAELETRFNEMTVYASLTSKPQDLKKAEELLPKLKNLAKARHARLWMRAGKMDEAIKLAGEAVSGGKNELQPLAAQVEIFYKAEKKDEAKKAFELLRDVAANADAGLPMLTRLNPIAESLGFPKTDWQNKFVVAKDLGERPPLDELGPFRWSPPEAPQFSITSMEGKPVTSADRAGKTTLMIFFLGKGCTHCMEQLNKFAPMQKKFADVGIDIVAVSTDSASGLKETLQTSDKPFPFPLFSDKKLTAFKDFRAYDDFEKMALHGTFLIDGDGQIRWQNISFEPFMHSDWLLEECQRLLSFGKSGTVLSANQ